MKIWVPLSIILLLIFIGLGVFFAAKNSSVYKIPKPTIINPISSPKQTVQVKAVLTPEQTSIKVGEETNYSVKIKDNTLGVSIVEGNFLYDPEAIEIIKIEPGDFLTNSNVLNSSIDPTQGKISYTLASLKYSSGEGELFKILIKAKSPSKTLKNILNFDKNGIKIGLRDLNKKYTYGQDEVVIIFEEQPVTILP